jgi:Rrf2 family transcriptional regulator, cysteine metabolism repressor
MKVSQKCQYAVRAILELAKRYGQGPVTIGDIARKQAVPPRFLEIILNEMKQGGLVRSTRGAAGGYELGMDPKGISVGQIIRLVDGPLDPVKCIAGEAGRGGVAGSGPGGERAGGSGAGSGGAPECPLGERCALINLWRRAKQAVETVYDGTSFQDLVDQEREMEKNSPADFVI